MSRKCPHILYVKGTTYFVKNVVNNHTGFKTDNLLAELRKIDKNKTSQ